MANRVQRRIDIQRTAPRDPRRVLLTGGSGFIGRHLSSKLDNLGWQTVSVARDGSRFDMTMDDRSSVSDWARNLDGTDLVIHLAAVAHRQAQHDELAAINERWPVTLFEAASRAGVADFVWLSSIKVLGDTSERPLRVEDAYRPTDVYAESKMKAEMGLLEAAPASDTVLTIIRPPLVYGPGVKANFATLIQFAQRCHRGLPLPLGNANGLRSLIGVGNLCELILEAAGHPGIFHGADPEDISVSDLLLALGARPALLWPAPASLMRGLAVMSGRREDYDRLFRPLQIDRRQTQMTLNWQPPLSMMEQIEETLAWFRRTR